MSGYQGNPPEVAPTQMAQGGLPAPSSMAHGDAATGHAAMGLTASGRHWIGETKSAFKTTELMAYVAAVLGVLIAAAVVDEAGNAGGGFDAQQAWLYITLLTVGYLLSRGLAKSGSRRHDSGR